MQLSAPWALADTEDPSQKALVLRIVYHSAEAIRIAGILLQPFMPGKAETLLNMIGVEDSKRTYDYAQFGADETYGDAKAPLGKGAWDSLFPPLSIET